MRIQDILRRSAPLLEGVSNTAKLDVELLLAYVLKKERLWILTHGEEELEVDCHDQFTALLARRTLFEPIAHLIGEKEFYGLSFEVTSDVLIPRPESEMLVEYPLGFCQKFKEHEKGSALQIIDLGTGSGCLLVALEQSLREQGWSVHGIGVDQSEAAIAVARKNAERHGAEEKLRFVKSDWFSAIADARYDIILANPPYIDFADTERNAETDFEPPSALFASEEGLADIASILAQIPKRLNIGGLLCLECGYNQGPAILSIAENLGLQSPEWDLQMHRDLNDCDRMFTAHRLL